MLQKQLLNLFLGYSLGIMTCVVISCGHGPEVRVNVSDPKHGGMEYFDQRTGTAGFTPYSETDKYVCFTPTDAQTILDYCAQSKK